jgi:hypothetical protein
LCRVSRDKGLMRTALKSVALIVAVAAMMLRASMPDGWMPSADASAPLMLCPGMTPMAAMPGMESPKHAPSHDQDHGGGMACPFAAAAQLAAPSDPVPAPLPIAVAHFEAFEASHDASPRAPHWQPNAARAPPALA